MIDNERHQCKHGHIDQWYKKESIKIEPHVKCHVIYDPGNIAQQWEKDDLLNKWFRV